jgi:predicted porin
MKKLLLGTTALMATGLLSQGALAQTATTDTPVSFKIGGQYYAGVGVMTQQDDDPGEVAYKREPVSVQDYFLIRFIGSTTFSNGVTAGVWTRLNAFSAPNGNAATSSGFQSSNNTTIKDSYLYVKNAATWGELRIGDDSDVRRNVATGNNAGAANGDGNLGANSASLAWLNTPVYNFTTDNLDGRGTKVAYYSPTIMGFQLGASFTPDQRGGHTYGPGNVGDNNGPTDRLTNGLTPSYLNVANYYNFYSLSGQWSGDIGPVKAIGTIGYSSASRKCGVSTNATVALGQAAGTLPVAGNVASNVCTSLGAAAGTQNANPEIYNLGFQLDYGPWELGADYEQSAAIAGGLVGTGAGQALTFGPGGTVATSIARTNEMVNKVVDMNFSYTVGAIRLGAEYSRGSFEGLSGDPDVKRAVTLDQIQIGGTYTLGPGVALIGMVQEALYDAGGAYIPTTGSFARTLGVSANDNVYAKSSDSTALIFETSIRF